MLKNIQELRRFRKNIGNNIHCARAAGMVTLPKLSRLSGISIEKIDQYELGKSAIRLEEIFRLAGFLEVEAEALLGNCHSRVGGNLTNYQFTTTI